MAKEDLLSKQINQLGYFLRRLLEKITKSDASTDTDGTVSEINTDLKEILGFDLEVIEKLSSEEMIPFLLQYEHFSVENLELFADILAKATTENFSRKALRIYEYIDSKTATFSMERNLKMQMIKTRFS